MCFFFVKCYFYVCFMILFNYEPSQDFCSSRDNHCFEPIVPELQVVQVAFVEEEASSSLVVAVVPRA